MLAYSQTRIFLKFYMHAIRVNFTLTSFASDVTQLPVSKCGDYVQFIFVFVFVLVSMSDQSVKGLCTLMWRIN